MSDMFAATGNVPLRGLEMFEEHGSVHVSEPSTLQETTRTSSEKLSQWNAVVQEMVLMQAA